MKLCILFYCTIYCLIWHCIEDILNNSYFNYPRGCIEMCSACHRGFFPIMFAVKDIRTKRIGVTSVSYVLRRYVKSPPCGKLWRKETCGPRRRSVAMQGFCGVFLLFFCEGWFSFSAFFVADDIHLIYF